MTRLAARFHSYLADPLTDGDLLDRFVADRDGEAFAELVRRHGPAVLAVCRHVTRHTHDADDAFQAVFLVLARRADEVRSGEPLGAWLYGVAVRVARKAVERSWRRREKPVGVPEVPGRAAEPFDPDVARAVVDEVGQLSACYRAAVVLCELEGRSRSAAARELGIAEGTLSSRLAAARKTLAARLTARGLGPTALAALVGVAVPPQLASATSVLATGTPAPAGVAALAHGVCYAMIVQRFKFVPLVAGLAASAVVAAGFLTAPAGATPSAVLAPVAWVAAAAPAPPVAKRPSRVLFFREGRPTLIDPDGKNPTAAGPAVPENTFPVNPRVSPDATTLAYLLQPRPDPAALVDQPPGDINRKLFVRPVRGDGAPTDTGVRAQTIAWAPDGKSLAATAFEVQADKIKARHFVLDLATRKQTPLALPEEHALVDWSADGRYFVTQQFRLAGQQQPNVQLHLMNRDGTPHKELNRPDDMLVNGRLSPDGRRVLCVQIVFGEGAVRLFYPTKAPSPRLAVLDVATGQVTPVAGTLQTTSGNFHGYCWSPDGRRIAHTSWHTRGAAANDTETLWQLVVSDPDGANRVTLATATAPRPGVVVLAGPDWR
jgi:RNA polymerase sigma factor (sigma-70 family)